MPRSRTTSPSTTSLLLGAAALVLGAIACGSGGGGSGGGAGGGGGSGGEGGGPPSTVGTCADPIDFNAHSEDMGSIPFVRGSLANGHEELESDSCGGRGKELVYSWTPPRDGLVRIQRINVAELLMIYVRTSCGEPETELGCVRTDPVQLEVKGGETLFFVVDSERSAPAYDFSIVYHPTDLQVGERCGNGPPLGTCAEGLTCVARQGRCEIGIPPTIEEGLAHVHGDRFLIRVWAHAPQGNIVAMRYRFLDEGGELTTDERYIDTRKYSHGQIDFVGGHVMPLEDAAGAVRVEVQLEDDSGGWSNAIEIPIVDAPIRAWGETCDPESFLGVCEEGLVCDTTQGPPRCEGDPPQEEQ